MKPKLSIRKTRCGTGGDHSECEAGASARRRGRVEVGRSTDEYRRPVSQPRSSNRTCGFPASGFPTDFIADSRTGVTCPALQPEQPQFPEDRLPAELAGALRGHLVPLSQKMPCALLPMFVRHPMRFPPIPRFEARFPASQLPIQPVAHFFPRSRVGGFRCSLTLALIRFILFWP
jgi:hypothetical protein